MTQQQSNAVGLLVLVFAAVTLAGCAHRPTPRGSAAMQRSNHQAHPARTTTRHQAHTHLAGRSKLKFSGADGLSLDNIDTTGTASYYGQSFAGQPTASGEPFDPNKLTAAHRSLPFGSRVLVTNLANGRRVTVRINDRGPFVGSRIIDLSRGAAKRLGMIQSGTAKVRLQVLSRGSAK